jgi:hypothetical protein
MDTRYNGQEWNPRLNKTVLSNICEEWSAKYGQLKKGETQIRSERSLQCLMML